MDIVILRVRPCAAGDLDGINEIYNHYIRTSHATFDLEERTIDWRQAWFEEHSGGRHRVVVAEREGLIIGFAASGPWRAKAAYATSVETSVYVAPDAVGAGVGRSLYSFLLEAIEHEDVHRAVAGVALPNDASVALHEGFGFRLVGRFTDQGQKFGRYWDVAWYEREMA